MAEPPVDSPRLSSKLLGAACLILPVIVIGALISAVVAAQRTVARSNQMYAKWHMGDLLVDYLRDNDNQWPDSWEQLEGRFDAHVMGGYSYEEIQTLLCVDFSVSKNFICDHLDEIRAGQIKLVWDCSGDDSHFEGGEPNQIIVEYFEHVCSQNDSHGKP